MTSANGRTFAGGRASSRTPLGSSTNWRPPNHAVPEQVRPPDRVLGGAASDEQRRGIDWTDEVARTAGSLLSHGSCIVSTRF
jgi:hypothetical protein